MISLTAKAERDVLQALTDLYRHRLFTLVSKTQGYVSSGEDNSAESAIKKAEQVVGQITMAIDDLRSVMQTQRTIVPDTIKEAK